jgi:hypothetical protein
MNAQRKKSAIAAILPSITKDTHIDEIKEIVLNDEKKYSEDEANEIVQALIAALNTPSGPVSINKKYAEWKVKPVYKDVEDGMGKVIGRKLTGFDKDAKDPIRYTTISPDKADLLNEQSENTFVRLFEA